MALCVAVGGGDCRVWCGREEKTSSPSGSWEQRVGRCAYLPGVLRIFTIGRSGRAVTAGVPERGLASQPALWWGRLPWGCPGGRAVGFMGPVMVLGAVHGVSVLVTLRIFAIGRSGPAVLR